MATNQARLNLGQPPLPDPIELNDDLSRFGNAIAGVWGKEGVLETNYGDYLRRVPADETVAVSGDTGTTANPGSVLHVQVTAGSTTGVFSVRLTGAPASGQVRVDLNANGTSALVFNAGDAVTECVVRQIRVPANLISHLDATTDPA